MVNSDMNHFSSIADGVPKRIQIYPKSLNSPKEFFLQEFLIPKIQKLLLDRYLGFD
jgi:hypothetical protein